MDELTIASRLPIVATDSYLFQTRYDVDRLAAKGVLHVRLRDPAVGSKALVDVFATHLQAGGSDQIKHC
ncbi:MAG: hypothetical protein H7Z42_02375 [Roseiflexaceae bacterium]|nr:hypothetical protein [Roseiflexaceae bacterium]